MLSRTISAPPFLDPPGYARHRPESTLLYQLVAQHYPAFRDLRAESGRPLPGYVAQEFEAYLTSGRLQEGFLRVRCEQCHAEKLVAFSCKKRGFCPSCGARRMAETAALLADEVLPERPLRQWVLSLPHALRFLLAANPAALTQVLGVVYRTIARYLISQAGLTRTRAATGAVTLIQRFGSALNLNIHFHMLFLDGAYPSAGANPPVFRQVAAPSANELQGLVEQIAARVGQVLERRGLIERDIENAWLGAARAGGFSLHGGLDISAREREKLERLCRYVSRPPVASGRLALSASGQVRYTPKTPYRDGTTHIVLEPLDLMARLAALVPPPCHGTSR
jgi:ribosomal protein S27E